MKRLKRVWDRFLCKLGFHKFSIKPILASIGKDHYWQQGGLECSVCDKFHIDKVEVTSLIKYVYDRGERQQRTQFLAYAKGLEDLVSLYGKDYVRNTLDKL